MAPSIRNLPEIFEEYRRWATRGSEGGRGVSIKGEEVTVFAVA